MSKLKKECCERYLRKKKPCTKCPRMHGLSKKQRRELLRLGAKKKK